MLRCDEINLDGSLKPQIQIRDSYVHGQKMRASMTYLFGRTLGLGSRPWQKSEVSGKMTGNPSISEQVSSYMMSLRTRKASMEYHTVRYEMIELISKYKGS